MKAIEHPLFIVVVLALMGIVTAVVCSVQAGEKTEQEATQEVSGVEQIMLDFAAKAPRHPVHKFIYRNKLAVAIVITSKAWELPVELVSAVVQRESSFQVKVRRGPAKEVGVMQVHPQTARRFKCEKMDTVYGQLDCGCKILAFGLEKCGTVEGALSVYGSRSGTCNPKRGGNLEQVVKSRMKLIEKHRGVIYGDGIQKEVPEQTEGPIDPWEDGALQKLRGALEITPRKGWLEM